MKQRNAGTLATGPGSELAESADLHPPVSTCNTGLAVLALAMTAFNPLCNYGAALTIHGQRKAFWWPSTS
jgi:hypothetical protein